MEDRVTIDEVHQKGTEAFGSEEMYQKRLNCKLPILNGETPGKWLVRKDASIQEIWSLLHRIEHGIVV